MAKSQAPTESAESTAEDLFTDDAPPAATPEPEIGPGVDVEALLQNEASDPGFLALLDKTAAGLPAYPDTMENAIERSDAFAGLGKDLDDDADTGADPPASLVEDGTEILDAKDPALIEMARQLGVPVEDLVGTPATPPADPPAATPEGEPAKLAPEVQAELDQVKALRAQLEQTLNAQRQEQARIAEVQALATQEAAIAAERDAYEAQQREAYEEQFEHMGDDERDALVDKLLAADLVLWDSQKAQESATARQQAQEAEAARATQEAEYTRLTADLVKEHPALNTELAKNYKLAEFLVDTHRAARDAYGDVGPFDEYAKGVLQGIKQIQTNAFRAGIAHAQQRSAKSSAAPPPLGNRGGGGAPATPRGGTPAGQINLDTFNFFAPDTGATRRR